MTWGENRLALLVHAPNCLVWTVRESQVTSTTWHREKMGKKQVVKYSWKLVSHVYVFSIMYTYVYVLYILYACIDIFVLYMLSCLHIHARQREKERNIDGSYLKVNMYHIVHNLLSYSISVICLRWSGFLLLTSMGRFFPIRSMNHTEGLGRRSSRETECWLPPGQHVVGYCRALDTMDMDEAEKYDDVIWYWFSWSWWWSCGQWWPFTVYHAEFLLMVMMWTFMETSCICTASRFDRGATGFCTQPGVLRTRAGTWGPTNVGKTSCRRKNDGYLFERHTLPKTNMEP